MKTDIKRSLLSQIPFSIRHQIHILKDKEKYTEIRSQNNDHLFNAFDKHRCLFVHIPKTGGVSVYRSLFSPMEGDTVVKSIGHFTLKDYGIIFGQNTLQKYFKFAFVRNPWARTLSSYQFLKKGGFHVKDKIWADANIATFKSFDEFIIGWLNPRNIHKALHFIPQHEFLTTRGEEHSMDFIGKLETIESDFEEIKEKLGIECHLHHHNKSKSAKTKIHYRDFYTKESRDIVSRVYKKDIDMFNYTF